MCYINIDVKLRCCLNLFISFLDNRAENATQVLSINSKRIKRKLKIEIHA